MQPVAEMMQVRLPCDKDAHGAVTVQSKRYMISTPRLVLSLLFEGTDTS